jgi:hydrogenase expression/formation protein HypC
MCLAIPGKIVEIVDVENCIAKVEVGGVKRNVNIGMLDKDETHIGDYVLIHVGFAMSKVDEKEAEETLRTLQELGQYQEELEQFSQSDIEQ